LRFSVFDDPWNVGVAPSTLPLVDATVRLWGRGEWFVNSIVTPPAFAVRDLVLYDNCPLGFASSVSGPVIVLVCAGVEEVLGVDAVPAELVPAELPQPQPMIAASASRPLAVKTLRMCTRIG
jgi:hypothetical protein